MKCHLLKETQNSGSQLGDDLENICCAVAKSCPTLWPHGLQHVQFLCPSLTPGVCSNSCSLNQSCYLTISSSAASSSSFCFQSFPASGSPSKRTISASFRSLLRYKSVLELLFKSPSPPHPTLSQRICYIMATGGLYWVVDTIHSVILQDQDASLASQILILPGKRGTKG